MALVDAEANVEYSFAGPIIASHCEYDNHTASFYDFVIAIVLHATIRSIHDEDGWTQRPQCRWFSVLIADDNRDLSDHPEDDLKRQRTNYNGDQLYSNVRIFSSIYAIFSFFLSLCPLNQQTI